MGFRTVHRLLADRGMAWLYAIYIAGYFLLPMAAGHRRLYYFLVLPAVLLLWRELVGCYRDNALAGLLLAYCAYMLASLLWSADFTPGAAADTLLYGASVLGFCLISGYLWTRQPQRMDRLARGAIGLAGGAAVVSIVAWYLQHPFPVSRLEPLGVMHHPNKAACAYGIFLVLCMHYLCGERVRQYRVWYALAAAAMSCLIILTQSRTALAALCVAALVLFGYRALLLVVLLGGGASWALLASNPQEWAYRVGAFSFRPGIWRQVLADMKGHWLVGQGYLVDPRVEAYDRVFSHAHNAYLASLRDGGIIGLGLLLALLGVALAWAWRLCRRRGERIYLALLLYAMTAIGMDYDRLLVHPKELWLFFWLPLALVMAVYTVRTPLTRTTTARGPTA